MRRLLLKINDIEFTAAISNSITANAIYNALPFKSTVQRWGDEILFEIPVKINEDSKATKYVEIGDIAYSTYDSSFCIFFGKTPLSTGENPKAHNMVTVFGKIEGNLELLKGVSSQTQIQVKRVSNQKSEIYTVNSKGRVIPIWQNSA